MKFIKTYLNMYSCRLAFTMIELMIVVIILGTIAGFAIPNYTKAVEKGYERDALNNITLIYSTQEVVKAKNGQYWPDYLYSAAGNVGQPTLNTDLGLSVPYSGQNGVNYACVGDGAGQFICYATRYKNFALQWQLYVDSRLTNGGNVGIGMPCCDAGYPNCPSLPDCDAGYIF